MDRFSWTDGVLSADEQLMRQQAGVRLYDGPNKTSFDNGRLLLTSHRFIWKDCKDPKCQLSLPLSCIVRTAEESSTLTKSAKIVLHLSSPDSMNKAAGPLVSSSYSYVRFSFTDGGQKDMYGSLADGLAKKIWERTVNKSLGGPDASRQFHSGIGGIEKKIQQKQIAADKTISVAFEDMSRLMEKAREMVALSANISAKIREKQGEISDDETIQFKAHLLSLGIDDPVTRETHGTGSTYYKELARQISSVMEKVLRDSRGEPMTLSDVYCRINRARGMELLSPDDLFQACKLMDSQNLPVVLRVFDSGVMVLQLRTHSEEALAVETTKAVNTAGSLTADELSRSVGLSVVLSRERLLAAERLGKLCRDETTEGLRFYPNRFLVR